jgi:hypothetical protein
MKQQDHDIAGSAGSAIRNAASFPEICYFHIFVQYKNETLRKQELYDHKTTLPQGFICGILNTLKKMKNFTRLFLLCTLSCLLMFTFNSCKKKGCITAGAVNYDSKAKKDDGSCLFNSDKLTGTWNVAETESGVTTNYTATIAKVNNNDISISSSRSNPPVYYMNGMIVTVDWNSKTLATPGTTIEGTITSDKDFEIHYLYGAGANIYSVEQHYTR